jgi:DNA polymerase elongation subunit (family B)
MLLLSDLFHQLFWPTRKEIPYKSMWKQTENIRLSVLFKRLWLLNINILFHVYLSTNQKKVQKLYFSFNKVISMYICNIFTFSFHRITLHWFTVKTIMYHQLKQMKVAFSRLPIDKYSGTLAIRELGFLTSCDILLKFMVPKYFCLLK